MIPLLIAPAIVAPVQVDPFADELKELRLEYQTRLREAIKPGEPGEMPQDRVKRQHAALKVVQDEMGPKFLALGKKAKGTPTGLGARMLAFSMAPATAADINELVELEAKNPDMARHLPMLIRQMTPHGETKQAAWLSAIEAATPFDGVKAALLYQRALATPGDEGAALIRELLEKYPTTASAAQLKAVLFEKENLQIGKVAPELVSKDENGEKITLSEYRGKVVVLDFWGFW
jgi:hypothetical protein